MKFTLYKRSGKRKIGNQPELAPGTIVAFVSAAAPGGWIACRGQTLNSVSDPTYANLYSAIGTTYGGSSASSFALPDLRLKVPIGAGTGTGLTARTRGTTGGSDTHSLTSTESGLRGHPHTKSEVAHGHSVATDSHSHGVGWNSIATNGGGTGGTWWPVDYGTGGATTQSSQNTTAGFSVGTSSHNGYGGTATFSVGYTTGSTGTPHSNKQPSLLVNYIIKI